MRLESTPPSNEGSKTGTMTHWERMDKWTHGLTAKFTQGTAILSPPSNFNGDDVNPFQRPDGDGSALWRSMTTATQTTSHDIDLRVHTFPIFSSTRPTRLL